MLKEVLQDSVSMALLEKRHAREMFDFVDRNRDHFAPWIPFVSKTRDLTGFEALIRKFLGWYAEGSAAFYGLWDGPKMIGMVLVKEIDENVQRAEIGYMIDRSYQGRGLVKAACVRLIRFLFEELRMRKLVICCDDRNERSIALARKLGFGLEGNLRQDAKINGEYCNTLHFGLFREEWAP